MATVEEMIANGSKVAITFKKPDGEYKDYVKMFNNIEHYNNYINKMMQNGYKEIGTYEHTKRTQVGLITDKDSILAKRKEPIEYTVEQREALELVQEFMKSNDNFFMLSGNAGTGKTTIAENIVRFTNATVMAPTNAAVKRLYDKFGGPGGISIDRFRTIHAVLYGAPDPFTGEFIKQEPLQKGKVYLIDESSMIDQKVFEDLTNDAKHYGARIIFLGDDFQLEPVGKDPMLFEWDKKHMSFKKEWKYKLNEVMRNDGSILKVATHLRSCDRPEIIDFDQPDFMLVNKFTSELPLHIADDANYIVLCSTNNKRMQYNIHIRRERFREDSKKVIVDHERLISVSNVQFLNGELYRIKRPEIIKELKQEINLGSKQRPEWKEFKMYLIRHEVEDMKGIFSTLLIPQLDKPSLHPMQLMSNDVIQYDPDLTYFDADTGYRKWKKGITIATYGYATSVHKSQGNEWDYVYIDCDWLSPVWDHRRWLYTAITRAKKSVQLTYSKFFKIVQP